MNANIGEMLNWFRRKKMDNIIEMDDGTYLSSTEAKIMLKWAFKRGYETLEDIPQSDVDNRTWNYITTTK